VEPSVREAVTRLEDLKEMRESIDYGTRMNRRLHHLSLRALQYYTSYKASFEEIPTAWINPEYTTNGVRCVGTQSVRTAVRSGSNAVLVSDKDHSDRGASVNIAAKGINKLDWNVPALNSLPKVWKVRRQASGAVDASTVTHDAV
jgi:IS605 OrfB family transposase